jgi:succinoglycan biosynthesis transport protein ExoP
MSAQQAEAEQSLIWQEPDFRELLSLLDRRRWWVVYVFLATLAIAVLFSLWARPVYRASAIVQVAGPAFVSFGPPQGQAAGALLIPESTSVETMVELIKRPEVLRRAASIAGLDADTLGSGRMSVRRVGTTNLVAIDVDSTDPIRASRLADAVAQATVDVNLQGRRRHFTEVRKYIETQLNDTGRRLVSVEHSIARFRSEGGNAALTQETAADIQRISELQSQRLALQLDIHGLQESVREDPPDSGSMPSAAQGTLPGAADSPTVKTLRDQLASLEVELAGLRAQFTDRYPTVKDAEARIHRIQELLRQEEADHAALLNAQLHVLEVKERILSDTIRRLESHIQTVPMRELRLEDLTREQKVEQDSYLFLAQKLEEARIAETSVGSEAQLASPAVVPIRPVKPNKPLNTLIGCIVGLSLGIGAALVAERFDDTLKDRDDVERSLGVPVLGVVPSVKRDR